MKSIAFVALPLALVAQVIWMLRNYLVAGISPTNDLTMLASLLGFTVLAATRGRLRALSTLLRAFLGVAFLVAVGDRFGLLGTPGSPGVSWGDWTHFVADTRDVNAFLPAAFAPGLAVLATIAEFSLGLTLLVGVRNPLPEAGAAVLLLVYAVAMTLSLGPLSPFSYSVYVLLTGAWALTTVDVSQFSLDAVLARTQSASVRSIGGSLAKHR